MSKWELDARLLAHEITIAQIGEEDKYTPDSELPEESEIEVVTPYSAVDKLHCALSALAGGIILQALRGTVSLVSHLSQSNDRHHGYQEVARTGSVSRRQRARYEGGGIIQ